MSNSNKVDSENVGSGDEYLKHLLHVYLSKEVAERAMAGDDKPKPHLINATVMFADIRSFTTISESTDPLDLYYQINAYFNMAEQAVRYNGGSVLGFGGDSVLALFGGFGQENMPHATYGIRAAGDIMNSLAVLNEKRKSEQRPPFRVGIGVNTGQLVVGNLGSEKRMMYTVLGDTINTAKRLSDLSKELPFYSIYATGACVENARGQLPPNWEAIDMGDISVAGKTKPVITYAISPP